MISFVQYLQESLDVDKLKHLEHLEDHIIHGGNEGVAHAADNLDDVHNLLQGKAHKARVTTKWDGCLAEDTRILLADGTIRTIKDLVQSWSAARHFHVVGWDGGRAVSCEVVDVLASTAVKEWVEVHFEDGSIRLTSTHEVLTTSGWKAAGELLEGEEIVDLNMDVSK